MARKVRVEYPGAIYHVMNRGDRREAIFREEADQELFLQTLGEACVKTGWQVHAYCLLGNHFHLVVETPQGNLVAGMKWFLGTYTGRFNRRHKLFGHLFSGRYKALIVDGSGRGYLKTVCEYVHLNPVRAKRLKPQEPLSAYRWSSYGEYLQTPRRRLAWMRVDRVFGEMGIDRDDARGRRRFGAWLEEWRGQEEPEEWSAVRRGWYYGARELKERLLVRMAGQAGKHHEGPEVWESAERKAEGIVREELKKREWREPELERRKKTDRQKIAIARRVRRETVMTVAWIGQRLKMGSRHTVANCLKQS
jgi:REP element-mobilizing transposase RayT